jgi:ABC-type phosphate transport system substrate-binding protein
MRRFKNIPLLLLLLAGIGCRYATAQNGGIAVVISENNPTTNLGSSDLRKIFAGEKRTWSNGVAIKIFVRGPGTLERDSLLNLLRMTEAEYRQHWVAQVFRGDAQSEPVTLPSNGMQREAVRAFPGAIELVNMGDVKAGMKVLKVDGRAPGENGYALR